MSQTIHGGCLMKFQLVLFTSNYFYYTGMFSHWDTYKIAFTCYIVTSYNSFPSWTALEANHTVVNKGLRCEKPTDYSVLNYGVRS